MSAPPHQPSRLAGSIASALVHGAKAITAARARRRIMGCGIRQRFGVLVRDDDGILCPYVTYFRASVKRRLLPLLASALAAAPAVAGTALPLSAPVPGGVAIVCLGPASEAAPRVEFDGRRVLVARAGDTWR